MPTQRGYRQACGIARALDLVGERWALLIVRELLLGPKRFTDLQAGLPTASPNALADRLRELAGSGVIRHRRLPAPSAAQVYELTEWGRELEPVVIALGTWALGTSANAEQTFVSVDSAMLTVRTYYRPSGADDEPVSVAVRLTDVAGVRGEFGVRLGPDGASVSHEVPAGPNAGVAADTAAFIAALDEHPRLSVRASRGLTIEGDHAAVQRLVDGVRLPAPR